MQLESTNYAILVFTKVRACNSFIDGPWSKPQIIYTPASMRAPCIFVHTVETTSADVALFKEVEDLMTVNKAYLRSGTIKDYILRYNGEDTMFTLEHLTPSTDYYVKCVLVKSMNLFQIWTFRNTAIL